MKTKYLDYETMNSAGPSLTGNFIHFHNFSPATLASPSRHLLFSSLLLATLVPLSLTYWSVLRPLSLAPILSRSNLSTASTMIALFTTGPQGNQVGHCAVAVNREYSGRIRPKSYKLYLKKLHIVYMYIYIYVCFTWILHLPSHSLYVAHVFLFIFQFLLIVSQFKFSLSLCTLNVCFSINFSIESYVSRETSFSACLCHLSQFHWALFGAQNNTSLPRRNNGCLLLFLYFCLNHSSHLLSQQLNF